jgi:hypothetical protein
MVAAKRRPQREPLHVQRHSSDMCFSAVIQIAEEEAGRGHSRSRLCRAPRGLQPLPVCQLVHYLYFLHAPAPNIYAL